MCFLEEFKMEDRKCNITNEDRDKFNAWLQQYKVDKNLKQENNFFRKHFPLIFGWVVVFSLISFIVWIDNKYVDYFFLGISCGLIGCEAEKLLKKCQKSWER